MPEYVDVPNVPLVKVGTWSASTGATPVTKEDLEAIVEAHESKALDKGVLKKGHLDPRHENPTWDGDPAYGQVDNLRLSEDGETLIGDYINMPKDLAESLPSAYPHRSVEIAWGVQLKDAAGQVKKKFKAALAGVALLGRTPPAVKGLGGPITAMSGGLECDSVGMYSTTDFALPGGLTANALREALSTIITDTFKQPATAGEYAGEWPWMIDYDDTKAWFRANGGVFQVGYTATDAGEITLADDVTEVIEKRSFVPVSDTPTVPQSRLSESEAKDVPDANGITTEREDSSMSEYLVKLRDKLGLPETATEEEILTAAANAVPDSEAAPAEETKPKGEAKPAVTVEGATAASEQGKHAAPAAEGGPENVLVSAAMFAELMETNRTQGAQLADLVKKDKDAHVDGLISKFSTEGKIHPTEKDGIRKLLMVNEADTVAMLSARAGIPVTEIGRETADAVQFGESADFTEELAFFMGGK